MSFIEPASASTIDRLPDELRGRLRDSELSSAQAPGSAIRLAGDFVLSRTASIGLALCIVAMWMLEHPYLGLINDALLYALGAFARLHPGSLGHDIFLSHGSQNGYTIFSPIVAPIMRLAGVGRAAALVTLTNQAIFFGGCAVLARKLMPASLAILSVALVVTLPGLYGAKHIFWFTEPLMTARVSAEAFIIGSLACFLAGRYVLTTVCLVCGMLLHPIMALPGVVFVFLLAVGMRRPWLTVGLTVGGLAVLTLISRAVPFGPVAPIDARWFQLLHGHLQYLFVSLWSVRAWGRMAVPAATLAVGAMASEASRCRSFCRAALAMAALGLCVSLLGCDLLRIAIVAQVQTWRWLWLSNAMAIVLLPLIAASCWRAGPANRAALLLLGASWISFDMRFGGLIALLAAGVAAFGRRPKPGYDSPWVPAAALAVVLASVAVLMESILLAPGRHAATPTGLTLLRSMAWAVASRWRPWASDGVLPALGFLGLWWIARRQSAALRSIGPLIIVTGLSLCAAIAPFAWHSWTNFAPSERLQARFALWRRAIPPTSEVFTTGVPLIPWFLLERPSYWSVEQMTGAVFSHRTTMELLRRETVIRGLHKTGNPERDLDALCGADRTLGFVVTSENMGPTPFKPIAVGDSRLGAVLRLYACSAHRTPPGNSLLPAPATHPS